MEIIQTSLVFAVLFFCGLLLFIFPEINFVFHVFTFSNQYTNEDMIWKGTDLSLEAGNVYQSKNQNLGSGELIDGIIAKHRFEECFFLLFAALLNFSVIKMTSIIPKLKDLVQPRVF